jgi:hypothetical protein
MEKSVHIEIKFTNATLAVLIGLLLAGALVALVWTTGVVVASPGAQGGETPTSVTGVGAIVGGRVNYQGRIEGASGPITMTFRLWEDETSTDAGDLLWEETKIVSPTGSLFNTQLGDTDPLPLDDIAGQELWLGVAVGTDDEMVPRQEILPVPYALSLRPGASIVGDQTGWHALEVFNQSEFNGDGIRASTNNAPGYGGYFANTKGETAIYADGHVRQHLTKDGLVKAAVFAFCDDDHANRGIDRSFNNVGGGAIQYIDGNGEGRCTIDFNFNVQDRYIVAVANHTHSTNWNDVSVTVRNSESGPADRVDFYRHDSSLGNGEGGNIAILVY